MTDTLPNTAALVVVDVQQGLDNPDYYGERNNLQAEENMLRIMQAWRVAGRPVYHVKHNSTNDASPLHPSKAGNALKAGFEPQGDEPLFEKSVNSGFIGTELESTLKQAGVTHVVIVGLTTNHCISTTTRMSANLGFTTYLPADATAGNAMVGYDGTQYTAQQAHDVALANLHEELQPSCRLRTFYT